MFRCFVLVLGALLLLTACRTQKHQSATQEEAIRVVEQALDLQGKGVAQELHGGFSGAKIFRVKIFVVSDGTEQYAVRFLPRPLKHEPDEITCLRIASEVGYGPHLYAVAPDWRWTVMEYVQSQPVSTEDRSSGRYYQQLGSVLSKMHHGPSFPDRKPILDEFALNISRFKKRPSLRSMGLQLQEILPVIQNAVDSVVEKAPCHDDLNPGNVLWTGSTIKIIDYGDAREDDPYFDIASLIEFKCFGKEDEDALLSAYFGGPMTKEEQAHLYLMKQAMRLVYTVRLLRTVSDEVIEENLGSESLTTLLKRIDKEGAEDPKLRAALGLAMFSQLVQDFGSKEFREATQTLSNTHGT
jgi:thiamine kinase-like enzyme